MSRRRLTREAAATAAILLALLAACGGGDDPVLGGGADPVGATTSVLSAPAINGVVTFNLIAANHVDGPVAYAQTPPVGGPHAPVWQNCGFYSAPVPSEPAVHSLEHGAVWITYRPSLDTVAVSRIQALAGHTRVLASPWVDESLPAPVVASAWNRQLLLDSVDDPRLSAFLTAFRGGAQSPEPAASCAGGNGVPG